MAAAPLMLPILRLVLATALAGSAGWLAWYIRRGGWGNALGRVLIIDRLIIIALLSLSALSVYLGLNRFDSIAVGWADIGLLSTIGPVMVWLIFVVRRATNATRRCPEGHLVSVLARYCPRCGRMVVPAD